MGCEISTCMAWRTVPLIRAPTNHHLHGKGQRNGTQRGTEVEKGEHFQFDYIHTCT